MQLHERAVAAGVRLTAHAVLGSTNAHALSLARRGERGPLWITAERQTQGRGREGRSWVSEPGNLHATLLLTAPGLVQHWPQLSFVAALALGSGLMSAADAPERLEAAADALKEVMGIPDKSIPQDLLSRAQCIVIVPGLKKGAFIVGAKYGKGFVSCRRSNGVGWSAPGAIRVEGGSVGFQIGAGETDLVFAVMNQRGMDKLMEDKFTVGGDASAMAGPVGRTAEAQTDAMMHAQILSWSRARGAFAGISLEGSTLRPDKGDNSVMYGGDGHQRDILTGKVAAPAAAAPLYSALRKYTPTAKAASR